MSGTGGKNNSSESKSEEEVYRKALERQRDPAFQATVKAAASARLAAERRARERTATWMKFRDSDFFLWVRNSYDSFMVIPMWVFKSILSVPADVAQFATLIVAGIAYIPGRLIGLFLPFIKDSSSKTGEAFAYFFGAITFVATFTPLILAGLAGIIGLNLSIGLVGITVGILTSIFACCMPPHKFWENERHRKAAEAEAAATAAAEAALAEQAQAQKTQSIITSKDISGMINTLNSNGNTEITEAIVTAPTEEKVVSDILPPAETGPAPSSSDATMRSYLDSAAQAAKQAMTLSSSPTPIISVELFKDFNPNVTVSAESKVSLAVNFLPDGDSVVKASNNNYYLLSELKANPKLKKLKHVKVPESLLIPFEEDATECSITFSEMKRADAVRTKYGHYYDRTELARWLKQGKTTCPQTRRPLSMSDTSGVDSLISTYTSLSPSPSSYPAQEDKHSQHLTYKAPTS